MHPLVRQAARYQDRSETAHVSLTVSSRSLPADEYPFALYHWRKAGVRVDDTLIAITTDSVMDGTLMQLLPGAIDAHTEARVFDEASNVLDRRHHGEWSAARANHVAENRELVQHRLQSLKVSHQARCKLLEDQVQRATDDKIRRMKESELARARNDYEQRVVALGEVRKQCRHSRYAGLCLGCSP